MAQPPIDLTEAQRIADQLKDEILHRDILNDASNFLKVHGKLSSMRAALLADMGVVPFLVQIIKSRDLMKGKMALILLDFILQGAKDKIPEIVDVNLVKTLVAKLREQHSAFCAAFILAIIAQQSEELREMIRRQGFMEAILVTAGNSKAEDVFIVFTRLLTCVYKIQSNHIAVTELPKTMKGFFGMILFEVHSMFERQEFDDSPESLMTVLPLVRYILEGSDKDSLGCAIVCSVLSDFFRHPMPAKVRELGGDVAPLVAELIESRDRGMASKAITCVVSLAGSGPLLTDQLVFRGVVDRLAKATEDGCNDEGVCLALRELVRHGGRSVLSSIEGSLLKWVESNLSSIHRNLSLAACTALVSMTHAEDTLPGRVGVTLGSLVGRLCCFLLKPELSEIESVLTYLAIALDTAKQHTSADYVASIKLQIDVIEKLQERRILDGKLYTKERARVLLERLRNYTELASKTKKPSVMDGD